MQSMTHKEYLTRLAWLEEEWNNPSRTDYYLMQIAQRVAMVLSKKPEKIKLDLFKLGFGKEENRKALESKMYSSKSAWGMILGVRDKLL